MYFPVVAKLLFLLDGIKDGLTPNLFVLVSESAALDEQIVDEGIDEDADYIHPFRGAVERESAADRPKVWFPLLGENQRIQLTRIYDLINPAEQRFVLCYRHRRWTRVEETILSWNTGSCYLTNYN